MGAGCSLLCPLSLSWGLGAERMVALSGLSLGQASLALCPQGPVPVWRCPVPHPTPTRQELLTTDGFSFFVSFWNDPEWNLEDLWVPQRLKGPWGMVPKWSWALGHARRTGRLRQVWHVSRNGHREVL